MLTPETRISNSNTVKLIDPWDKKTNFTEKILSQITKSISSGSITFEMENGKIITHDSKVPGPDAKIYIHSFNALRRIISSGYLGLAEGYINKEWSSPSLAQVFDFGGANLDALDNNLSANLFVKLANKIRRFSQINNKRGSRKNIANHYDLGNDFFNEWLDQSMTYSSGLYGSKKEKLEAAQQRKYHRIIEMLDLKEGDKVLEIGCGWGGFAEYAATTTGAQISAITISKEQYDFATKRIANCNLSKNVEILLQDYRDVTGTFNKIVSIEMLEAVGEAYWPAYFKTLSDLLPENGMAMIQVIVVANDYFEFYRKDLDFIQRYIFPGGMLLSSAKIEELCHQNSLKITDTLMFGHSYARTLQSWQNSFQDKWEKIEKLGFDDRFKRIWEYYLDYTAAGFRSGTTNVGQFCIRK